jgi:Tfp pilus assembly protein PilN
LEPAAACLIAVSPEREGRERRNALATRVLLGESHLLAVMSRGAKPIHWQRLPLPPGDEATGIVSAIRSLETAAGACGLDRTPDTVVIHGRSELQSLTDQSWLTDSLEGSFRWVESPALKNTDVAQALADRLLSNQDEGFDLVRQHRDPLQLRRVVPYKEIVAYLLAASILAGVLWMRLDKIRTQHTALLAGAPPMVADGTNPKSEKDRLSSRTSAVSQFLDHRVRWSGVLGEITQTLPEGMRLTAIRGSAPLPKRGRRQTKSKPTTLVLQAECALHEDGSMPQSLDSLAEKLHALQTVQPHFQSVELSDVRRTRSQDTGIGGAAFSVILTAKTKGGR